MPQQVEPVVKAIERDGLFYVAYSDTSFKELTTKRCQPI